MATLYTFQGNSAAQIIQASAAVHQPSVSLSVKNVAPGETPSGFPAYASCPVLTTKQGQNLTQLSSMISEVIGKSICTTGLEWISFAENVLTPNEDISPFSTRRSCAFAPSPSTLATRRRSCV